MIDTPAYDLVDVERVKEDFETFLDQFGCPIFRRYFTSASSHPYYGTRGFGESAVISFHGGFRYVTADDFRLVQTGRIAVGDAIMYVKSGVEAIGKEDEFWIKGASSSDYYNVTWKQANIIGSQVVFYEAGLTKARGRR